MTADFEGARQEFRSVSRRLIDRSSVPQCPQPPDTQAAAHYFHKKEMKMNINVEPKPMTMDDLTEDQLLMQWADLKLKVEAAKAAEMEMRKYIVSRAFPEKIEGTNNKDLGNGYTLKAGIKFNYKIAVDNNKLEECLDRIAKIGNRGNIVAERMISWTPNFLLQEYRLLQDEVNESPEAKEIMKIVNEFLVITDAAPTLEIKEPKIKK